jgi:HD-like signal output (HDOD) protein
MEYIIYSSENSSHVHSVVYKEEIEAIRQQMRACRSFNLTQPKNIKLQNNSGCP